MIRIKISANGIERFYFDDKDLDDWAEHLYQQGHTENIGSKDEASKTPYSSGTYSSLYKDELIGIMDGDIKIVKINQEEKVYLIKIVFNMFINKWGYPDVPYQI